ASRVCGSSRHFIWKLVKLSFLDKPPNRSTRGPPCNRNRHDGSARIADRRDSNQAAVALVEHFLPREDQGVRGNLSGYRSDFMKLAGGRRNGPRWATMALTLSRPSRSSWPSAPPPRRPASPPGWGSASA